MMQHLINAGTVLEKNNNFLIIRRFKLYIFKFNLGLFPTKDMHDAAYFMQHLINAGIEDKNNVQNTTL